MMPADEIPAAPAGQTASAATDDAALAAEWAAAAGAGTPPDDAALAAEWAAAEAGGPTDGNDPMAAGWAGTAALDQNDIDSLFGAPAAVSGGGVRRGFEALVGGAVTGIDRLPMLNIVVDRLGRSMTASMRKFTADNADVSIERVRPVRLKDFLGSIALPAMIAVIHIEQWDAYCLAVLDSRLIGSMVDVLLGGRRNRAQPIEGRPFTTIERTFVDRLVNQVIVRDLKSAFESICEVDFVFDRFESTPSFAAITKLSAPAITFRAEIMMDGRGGHVDFLIPYSAMEPVRDVLAQDFVGKKQGGDLKWREHMMQEMPRANVRLRAVIARRRISSADVARWHVGSRLVLDCRHDEPIDVFCGDLLVLRARIAERGGRVALRVEEQHVRNNWPGPGV